MLRSAANSAVDCFKNEIYFGAKADLLIVVT